MSNVFTVVSSRHRPAYVRQAIIRAADWSYKLFSGLLEPQGRSYSAPESAVNPRETPSAEKVLSGVKYNLHDSQSQFPRENPPLKPRPSSKTVFEDVFANKTVFFPGGNSFRVR